MALDKWLGNQRLHPYFIPAFLVRKVPSLISHHEKGQRIQMGALCDTLHLPLNACVIFSLFTNLFISVEWTPKK